MKIFSSLQNAELVAMLQNGAVGVLPTDTVYGLVCRAGDEAAVARLYALKSREHKPGTLVAMNIEQLADLGIRRRYLTAVEQFWPGAVSVVLPTPPELNYLDLGLPDLAMRVTADVAFADILQRTGPLLTTSANTPGAPPAVNLTEAQNYFAERVDFYVNSENLSDHKPSTVLRIVDDAIEVLREGAVTIDENGRVTT